MTVEDWDGDFGEPNPVVVPRTYTEADLREAKAQALEEAAVELLSDESAPPKSIKEMYNAIYATWLQRRAAAVRGEG